MATFTLPADFAVSKFSIGIADNAFSAESPFTLDDQVIDMLGERWKFSVTTLRQDSMGPDAGAIDALLFKLRNRQNKISLWNFARPVPKGTLRSAALVKTAVAQGAVQIVLKNALNATGGQCTLLPGDMFSVNGMLMMVQDPCTSVGGEITVKVCTRFRKAVAVDTPVIWDKPTADFRIVSGAPSTSYSTVIQEETAIEFLESW